MSAEGDSVRELALVVDSVDVEDADADPVRPDAEAHVLARQVVLREELVERTAERGDVAHLAGDDDAGLERLTRHLDESSTMPSLCDLGGGDLRRADLDADDSPASAFFLFFGGDRSSTAELRRRTASASASGRRA